ncbi:PREDICTED: unique cartilage matrix-associated protein isoform X1 [Nanorana parkeri]|uniref:unique cartilage matrix-associated protein isoform X1 n=1 Tax=Nanorana parkeri TaxID=125878 RepID=UPI0008550857|nr:PREDICTED: unique cartilage matrix-associated protein isoform X1 [Nanorana parkeri]
MNWKQVLFLSFAAAVVLLAVFQVAESAAVRSRDDGAADKKESLKKIFVPGTDASNFFKKRGKRSTKSQDEINAENRQRLSADERRREYYEEQRNEFENYVEEEQDEQEERTREQVEQWRQWHYDGLSPSYIYQRQNI